MTNSPTAKEIAIRNSEKILAIHNELKAVHEDIGEIKQSFDDVLFKCLPKMKRDITRHDVYFKVMAAAIGIIIAVAGIIIKIAG